MLSLLIIVFVLGYIGIVLEHSISVNKSSSALLTGAICWAIAAFILPDKHIVESELMHHVGEIAGIVFFLMGAMTIVELIDNYNGFEIITNRITTQNKRTLLWIISIFTFILSAILDNLTTTIVMVALIKKLVEDKNTRLLYIGMIVIAANAGGAWSPMGDVTTTMLWIGGQITAINIVKILILPSIACLIVPTILLSFTLKGNFPPQNFFYEKHKSDSTEQKIIFLVGLGGLIFVPIFKAITHLPPFIGMLLVLGFIWLMTELLTKRKDEEYKAKFSIMYALQKTDLPSLLFFVGILLAVSSLQTVGILGNLAMWLNQTVKDQTSIVVLIGLLSSIVDNVPLVAAAMGMYPLEVFPTDHKFWELLAYCSGTGGSALIIGSAAGVAAMGMEKIDFFWYIKRISFLALAGYFAGIMVFILQSKFF
ncbi:Citrate transporter (plasmid) [Emticicia oligotrophica DSM 17448]|uniref:Citrate transporter n=1 Tax=Emticicia oligotrophica (strain DSM 17448 / CIP 109782 / MTCC 6937 / GPTSA100-15) TaxID=929562 RepID=A0ABM5N7X0_EMTOG|nr:sodium:proton antiporter NhaD [Emticicia oligotrophica]AFK05539.1 Citrate transporter [Emticicia oligotrophica DSM 17448]